MKRGLYLLTGVLCFSMLSTIGVSANATVPNWNEFEGIGPSEGERLYALQYIYADDVDGTWVAFDNGKWKFQKEDGTYLTNTWYSAKDDENTYYLNSKGWMQTGWFRYSNYWYYCDDRGILERGGWIYDNDTWYYIFNAMQTGWLNDNETWYYLSETGAMQTGWLNDNGTWYYLSGTGEMQTGWVNKDNTWYFMNESGAMQTGWIQENGNWYFLDESGAMQIGWQKIGDKWYFLGESGAMQTGWLLIGNEWYYMNPSGEMASEQWVGNYYVNSDGTMTKDS